MRDEQMFDMVKFFVAPKTLGDMSKAQFLWVLLCDQIHHRGQFSVYLRMADGKLPSIYGPDGRRALELAGQAWGLRLWALGVERAGFGLQA